MTGDHGAGRRAFIIGHPVAHSRSPVIHGYWLRQFGLPGSYERIDVPPDEVAAFVRGFREAGFAGGNVTIPDKEHAFRAVDVVTPNAERLGAVNTLWLDAAGRVHGDNTDGMGFVSALDEAAGPDWSLRARHAVVLGAGGAARAIVPALAGRGVRRITIANRSGERARDVADLVPDEAEIVPPDEVGRALASADILVNTTQLGMVGQPPLEIDLGPLPVHAIVADAVYVPLETPLLAAARARGNVGVDGLGMLLHQARPGFERWFGRTPTVTPALREHVVADLASGH